MKLSISNIAWSSEQDDEIYAFMQTNGFVGLEIAPTRIFPDKPYEHLAEAKAWAKSLLERYGLVVSSMQSIWYGRTESIFGSAAERTALVDYTKQTMDFAVAIGCSNLVFGCPKNRNIPDRANVQAATDFFAEITVYAAQNGVVIALEPNPPIYGTNFINTTDQAFEVAKHINSRGFAVNIDCGTLIHNNESLNIIRNNIAFVNHFHLSEPNLVAIENRELHKNLANLLNETDYNKFVSIEMKNLNNIDLIREIMQYARGVFCENNNRFSCS